MPPYHPTCLPLLLHPCPCIPACAGGAQPDLRLPPPSLAPAHLQGGIPFTLPAIQLFTPTGELHYTRMSTGQSTWI